MNEAAITLLIAWHQHKQFKGRTGVYAIRNLLNGKVYVGSASKCFRERWRRHLWLLRHGRHHSRHLQGAWDKDGEDKFSFEILIECESQKCIQNEQNLIVSLRAVDDRFGYNILPVAGSSIGWKHSAESIEKMRQSSIGYRHTPESKALLSRIHKGRKFSAETLERMSRAQKRRMLCPQERQRLASHQAGRPLSEERKSQLRAVNLGSKRTDEMKAKISAANRRRKLSEETKRKIGDSSRGRKYSSESRMKMSVAHRGKRHTHESLKKMSAAAVLREQRKREKRATLDPSQLSLPLLPSC